MIEGENMSEQENVRTIEELYAAFGRGDVPSVLKAFADDVDWQFPRPADIPWGGNRRGRQAVAEFFAAVNEHLEIEEFSPQKFVSQDDEVIVFGHERARTRSTGRVYQADWVHVFMLRGGSVARFREYTDTAAIVEALSAATSVPAEGKAHV
jgi:ketosteroid isomerase-like protein